MGKHERPDLVIFDCDGVLVDSEPIVIRVLAEHMRQLGIDITNEECAHTFVGLAQGEAAELVVRQLGTTVPAGWFDMLTVAVDAALAAEVRPVPGVVDVLRRLDVPFCVASNGRQEKVALTLAASGLDHYFSGHIFTAADVARGKPEPDLFLLAAARMGALPQRCVVVEDSAPGIAAGRAAGMRVLQYVPASGIAATRGDATFASMAGLPALLGLPPGQPRPRAGQPAGYGRDSRRATR